MYRLIIRFVNWVFGFEQYRVDAKVQHIQQCICEDCDNVFFVIGGSDEFLPNYCCYCGQKVYETTREKR